MPCAWCHGRCADAVWCRTAAVRTPWTLCGPRAVQWTSYGYRADLGRCRGRRTDAVRTSGGAVDVVRVPGGAVDAVRMPYDALRAPGGAVDAVRTRAGPGRTPGSSPHETSYRCVTGSLTMWAIRTPYCIALGSQPPLVAHLWPIGSTLVPIRSPLVSLGSSCPMASPNSPKSPGNPADVRKCMKMCGTSGNFQGNSSKAQRALRHFGGLSFICLRGRIEL